MLPAFLLALREGTEMALVLGIVTGALRKTQRSEFSAQVWAGAASAALISALVAVLLNVLGTQLVDPAEAIFEAVLMLAAAGILTWMIFWMQRQSRFIKSELEAGVRRATSQGSGRWPIFWLAFVAVLREGVELALFLAAAAFTATPGATVLGALLGLLAAACLGWALFAATVRLNLHTFFQVTSVLLILFAAGFVAHGVHELNEVNIIPALVEHIWDLNPILNEASTTGTLLQTLFGYNGNPSLTETLAYFGYLSGILFTLWRSTVSARLTSQNA